MHKTHNCELDKLKKDKGWQNNIQKAYKHTWEAGTDVHDGVMLDSRFSPQVTNNEDSGWAIGFC